MIVAINALSATVGGGWTYIANLLPNLCIIENGINYILLVYDDPNRVAQLEQIENDRVLIVRVPKKHNYLAGLVYEQYLIYKIVSRYRPDLILCPAGIAPIFFSGKVAIVLRNINHLQTGIDWNLSQRVRLGFLRHIVSLSARRADRVIYVSHTAATKYSAEMDIPRDKSHVVYHGVNKQFDSTIDAAYTNGPWNEKPYILSVSSIYRYKNFHTLIRAYGKLVVGGGLAHDLVIVGKNLDELYYRELLVLIKSLSITDRVHLLGEVEYEKINKLYMGSDLFVFPSFLESFGHPLLEAMCSGVPVISADIEVSREIAGDGALYFEPTDTSGLADIMKQLLKDKSQREKLVKKGREREAHFSWIKTAQDMVQIFQQLLQPVEAYRKKD